MLLKDPHIGTLFQEGDDIHKEALLIPNEASGTSIKKFKKGQLLGNLSNVEIESLMLTVPGFQGIFMRDEIDKTSLFDFENEEWNEKKMSAIINLDDSTGNGTHWVAIFYEKRLPYGEYFDSFGLPPPKEIMTLFMKRTGKLPLYSDQQYQMDDSDLCGFYAMYYILERMNGSDMYDIIESFKQKPSQFNENLISNYDYEGTAEEILKEHRGGGGGGGKLKKKKKLTDPNISRKRKQLIENRIKAIQNLIDLYSVEK